VQPEPGALELFLDTIRSQEATNQIGLGDASDYSFKARGSVHEVMQISVFNGDGLPELDRRIRQMLGSVEKVLRAYEELHGIEGPEDDGWRSSVKREKAVLQVRGAAAAATSSASEEKEKDFKTIGATRSSVKEVRGMGVQDPTLLSSFNQLGEYIRDGEEEETMHIQVSGGHDEWRDSGDMMLEDEFGEFNDEDFILEGDDDDDFEEVGVKDKSPRLGKKKKTPK
jgi:hypothetical protein